MKTYRQPGDHIDITPTANVAVNQLLVFGILCAIANTAILANVKGSVCIDGVHRVPKATGAINVGDKVYFDVTNQVVTTTATGNTYAGVCVLPAASGDATVDFKLNFHT